MNPDQAEDKSSKGARGRSGVQFPYFNLDSSVKVAEKIHHDAGGSCTREQLAAMLGYNGTKNGGFLSRFGAARVFGLVEEVSGMIRPTPLAAKIFAPVEAGDADRGKVSAFLNVELFEKLYERYKGQPLPNQQGLENLLSNEFKVVPAQVKNSLRVFSESAETAGFFHASGRGRLVLPLVANGYQNSSSASSSQVEADPHPTTVQAVPAAPIQPRDLEPSGIPPAIFGLIRDLPAEGTKMSSPKRQRLIKAFEASINWLYPDENEEEN